MKVEGNYIDLLKREIYPAKIHFNNGLIEEIERIGFTKSTGYIMTGLIDAHIHIESSMTTPGAFATAAVSRGTTAVVSDPHEIANVLGLAGVKFMIEDSKKVPLKFWFGAPSCVPATEFETAGAILNHWEIEKLLKMPQIKYLAEMMNFPGVIYNDLEVHKKIRIAKKLNKQIDGHAPGLSGDALTKYIASGISTDHECSTIEEALEKIALGMKILIREGSAAKNLDALKELYRTHPDMVMLCSDDLHPETLAKRHINTIVARLISEGFNIFDVISSCTINPSEHYNLGSGSLQSGDPADFIVVNDYRTMDVLETWIDGEKVFDGEKVLFVYTGADPANKFNCSDITAEKIRVAKTGSKIRVIEASDGELITRAAIESISEGTDVGIDVKRDLLKIVVKDRYNDAPPATGFINGFRLKKGAFASSVSHDSHNIICIGTNDGDIINAVNEIIRMQGGLAVANGKTIKSFPLPVAGIMSDQPVDKIAVIYEKLSDLVKSLGCEMSAPFMTLSFMALLVIPELKISDRGLFDVKNFKPVPLFID
jgi:adenine deaminase